MEIKDLSQCRSVVQLHDGTYFLVCSNGLYVISSLLSNQTPSLVAIYNTTDYSISSAIHVYDGIFLIVCDDGKVYYIEKSSGTYRAIHYMGWPLFCEDSKRVQMNVQMRDGTIRTLMKDDGGIYTIHEKRKLYESDISPTYNNSKTLAINAAAEAKAAAEAQSAAK